MTFISRTQGNRCIVVINGKIWYSRKIVVQSSEEHKFRLLTQLSYELANEMLKELQMKN